MKKIMCMLLAALSCCVFAAAASAEGQQETTTTVSVSDAATQTTSAAQGFAGAVKISFETAPINTRLPVSITIEGGTLTESDIIRYRLYSPDLTVSDADADPEILWQDYTGHLEVEENTVIEAAVFFGDGSRSPSVFEEIDCIDLLPPSPPQILPSTTEWTREPVTVTLSGGSDDQSGLRRLEYRIGAEGTWAEYTDAVSIASASTVYARSVDVAGNVSEAAVLEVSNFDTTAPDTSAMAIALSSGAPVVADTGVFSKYFSSQVTASVSGAVDPASGVAGYQYQLVSSTESLAVNGWHTYDPEHPPVISGDYCGYVYARAIDRAGNISAPVASEGFVIDVTPPVISNIKLSDDNLTASRVIVTFTVDDNYLLETVTVNDVYAGLYVFSFTAFRNDDYVIVAYDKAGNRTEETVTITNINATPFNTLSAWQSLDPQDFTPATWSVAQKAADELQSLINTEAAQAQIEAAANKLLTALEGLVSRGDGTLARELLERVNGYDPETYTESSWACLREAVANLESVLNDPESTQERVDTYRRAVEQQEAALVKRADFTDLDRLISQCERLDTSGFSMASYAIFSEALTAAKELSRTDSGQSEADAAYALLLSSMGSLQADDDTGFDFTPLVFVILGLLIVALGTALLIIHMRAENKHLSAPADDQPEEEYLPEGYGDIQFIDEEDEESQSDEDYIGRR